MDASMTVTEIFRKANLSPLGPVPWGTQVPELCAGVYVVARVGDPYGGCKSCVLPFIDQLPPNIDVDLESERQRWLPNEPIVYIGQTTDQTLAKRIRQFYRHKCGDSRPHAGGQVVKLLRCNLWVYWSPATDPLESERTMILAFKNQAGQEPFANWDGKQQRRRIRRSN